jgi:hypothetical protein
VVFNEDLPFVPSLAPASLCDNFKAGNLKKMNKNREPSKKHDTSARMRIFVSLKMYLNVDLVVFMAESSASSCCSNAASSNVSRWLAP